VEADAFALRGFNHAVDPADADAEFFCAADSIAAIPSSFGALLHTGANITGYASAASIFPLTFRTMRLGAAGFTRRLPS
jgi:hypothetical protein